MIDGDPTDNNAALFKQGYAEALQPKIDSGDYTLVGEQTGKWDADEAGKAFEQIFTAERRQGRRRRLRQRHHGRRHHRPSGARTVWPARFRSPGRTPASKVCSGSSLARSA